MDPSYIGLKRLVSMILVTAVEDWEKVKQGSEFYCGINERDSVRVHRRELVKFFQSDWFHTLTEIVEMDATKMLFQLGVKNG